MADLEPHIRTVISRHEAAVLPTQLQPSMIHVSYSTPSPQKKNCLAKGTKHEAPQHTAFHKPVTVNT